MTVRHLGGMRICRSMLDGMIPAHCSNEHQPSCIMLLHLFQDKWHRGDSIHTYIYGKALPHVAGNPVGFEQRTLDTFTGG